MIDEIALIYLNFCINSSVTYAETVQSTVPSLLFLTLLYCFMSYNMCDDIDYFIIFKIGFKHLMEDGFKCLNDQEQLAWKRFLYFLIVATN